MLTVQFGLAERQNPPIEGRPFQEIVFTVLSSEGIPSGMGSFTVSSSVYKQYEPLFGKAFTPVVALDFIPLPEPKLAPEPKPGKL